MKAKKHSEIVSKTENVGNESAILYETFERKNVLENKMVSSLTPLESLIHTLDLMDFKAIFQAPRTHNEVDEIDWIILQLPKK